MFRAKRLLICLLVFFMVLNSFPEAILAISDMELANKKSILNSEYQAPLNFHGTFNCKLYEKITAPSSKDDHQDFIFPDSDKCYLKKTELDNLSKDELRIAKNEIYARRGRLFHSDDLQRYFNSCKWYSGTVLPEDFKESVFNEYEMANVLFIDYYQNGIYMSGADKVQSLDSVKSGLTGVYVFEKYQPSYQFTNEAMRGATVKVESTSDGNYIAYLTNPDGSEEIYDTFIKNDLPSSDIMSGLRSTYVSDRSGNRYYEDDEFYLILHGDGIVIFHGGDGIHIYRHENAVAERDVVFSGDNISPDETDITMNEPVQHVIAGTDDDNNNNNTFIFDKGEEIEDLVLSTPSNEYNPRLAIFLAQMARSAYNEERLRKNLSELGFGNIDHNEFSDANPLAGYYIAQRKLDDGSKLVLITIKGSTGMQWLTDFAFGKQLLHDGCHYGFSLCVEYLFADLKADLMNSIPTENTTYVITGHSLGGAVSNLLAVLLDDVGVPNTNVYSYNFGCPNVAIGSDDISSWNDNGEHNNIINIGNYFDQVTYVPNALFERFAIEDWEIRHHAWKKYGVSYWFDDGFHFANYAHDMQSYVDYLAKRKDKSEFRTSQFSIPAFGFMGRCPIDFVIYNSAGEKVASVINNECQYYDKEIGDEAIIFVNEDRKLFYLLGNDDYSVIATSTNQGEMDLDVAKFDLVSGVIDWVKSYESVNLVTGKTFSCEFGKAIPASDITLYVTDEGGKPIREVREDGNEVEMLSTTEAIDEVESIGESSGSLKYVFIIVVVGIAMLTLAATLFFVKKKKQ